jgi:O-succinylbenzoic acid--CoA ligase
MQLNLHSKPVSSYESFHLEEFWNNDQVDLFLNPKFTTEAKERIFLRVQDFVRSENLHDGFVGLATSGTTGSSANGISPIVEQKILILSKQAIMAAAQIVIDHFGLRDEVWILNLPIHHIGGLSLLARSFLMKTNSIYMNGWSPHQLVQTANQCRSKNILVSLVPTQIYDMAKAQLKCPPNIKRVFVGGGQLSESLYHQGLELGWPMTQTYGMTETSAMIAEFDFQKKLFKSLSGISVQTSSEGRLAVSTPGLFSFELSSKVMRQQKDVFYITDDLAVILDKESFRLQGRIQNQIKILGELVNITKVEEKVLEIIGLQAHQAAVVAVKDDRRENKLILCIEREFSPSQESLLTSYNNSALGYERIDCFKLVDCLPKTDLGKINRFELEKIILR